MGKRIYVVFNEKAGIVYGTYSASSRAEALDKVARDAGYNSYNASCEVAGEDNLYATRAGRVIDYATGIPVAGDASDGLIIASYKASPEGAVRARREGDTWVPDNDGTHTVFVEFD